MGKKDDPSRLRKGREFLDYAVRHGCEVRNGGRHTYVRAPNGRGCPLPMHPGDLPEGTRRSILKMFAEMGILPAGAALLLVCAAAAWLLLNLLPL